MSGNSFGSAFKVTVFGESHGEMVGMVIDGCPAGLDIDMDFIQYEMDRRKPGQSKITTQRKEADEVKFVSGIFEGKTTGTPITGLITNTDQRSNDYSHIQNKFRPSHADFTYDQKYGHRDYRGGGRSSARETAARVMAGAIAKQILKKFGIEIYAYVSKVGTIEMTQNTSNVDYKLIESNIVRCPETEVAKKMISFIEEVKSNGDTIGGVVSCVIKNCPVGLGEPVFDKLHADLGKAMLSINAVKGFEYGSGFSGVELKGSMHNDEFLTTNGKVTTKTNHSGGIQGGISNGMDIDFKVAFKPVATIMKSQESVDTEGKATTVEGKGRHDPCVVPRAVPIVEAMAAITIVDHLIRNQTAQLGNLK
jgi:chorismate synthase